MLGYLAATVSRANRERKWRIFLDEYAPTAMHRVLDVGFSEKEYSPVDNFVEKHYPHPEQLTALGVDDTVDFIRRYSKVKVVRYEGGRFPFEDNAFDICWSNAVIEHVGGWQAQTEFLSEVRRVARNAFVTTPNRWFPIEVHTRTPFLHYLPKRVFDRYLTAVGKKWATGDYMHLLSGRQLKRLLAEAGIFDYRLIRNRVGGFTVDFVVLFGEKE
jgi:SAM-dependent methyltransferase